MVKNNDIIFLLRTNDAGHQGEFLTVVAALGKIFLAQDASGNNYKMNQSGLGLEFMVHAAAPPVIEEDWDDKDTGPEMPKGLNAALWTKTNLGN